MGVRAKGTAQHPSAGRGLANTHPGWPIECVCVCVCVCVYEHVRELSSDFTYIAWDPSILYPSIE